MKNTTLLGVPDQMELCWCIIVLNPVARITFKDMFPTSLTPVPFSLNNVTDINYIMATAFSNILFLMWRVY